MVLNKLFEKERFRTGVILLLGFAVILYIVLSEHLFFEAEVYGGFGILTILGLLIFPFFWKHSSEKLSEDKAYYGIGQKWLLGIIVGIIFSFLFIGLTKLKFFGSVAQLIVPQISLSSLGATAIVVIALSPLFEESGTTATIMSFFGLYMPLWLSILLKSFIFSALHFYAYVIVHHTSFGLVIGDFIGAFIFAILTGILASSFKKFGIGYESSIACHLTFNLLTYITVFHTFSIVG